MKNILAEKWKRYNSLPNIVLAKELVSKNDDVREDAIQRALQLSPEDLSEILSDLPQHNLSLRWEVLEWIGLFALNLTLCNLMMYAFRSGAGNVLGFGLGLFLSLILSYPVLRTARSTTNKTQLKLDLRRKSTCQIFSKMTNPTHIGVLLDSTLKYRVENKTQFGYQKDIPSALPAWMRFPLYDAMRRLVPEATPEQCRILSSTQLMALQQTTEVFIDCNEPLTGHILMALAEAGYVKAKPLFKKIGKSTGHSQALRDSAIAAGERLKKRLAEIKEVSVLLRPAYFQGDDANLLIPAGNVAQEKASENLLRPGNYQTPESTKSEEVRVSSQQ